MPVIPTYEAHDGLDPDANGNKPVKLSTAVAEANMGMAKQISAFGSTLETTLGDIGKQAQQRQEQKENLAASLGFQDLHQRIAGSDIQAQQSMPIDGANWADSRVQNAQSMSNTWMSTLPPRLQDEYAQRSAVLIDGFHNKYAEQQSTQSNNYWTNVTQQETTKSANGVFDQPTQQNFDNAWKNADYNINNLPVPDDQREKIRVAVHQQLLQSWGLGAAHQQAMQNAASKQGVVGPDGVLRYPGADQGSFQQPVQQQQPQTGAAYPGSLPAGMRNNNPGNIKFTSVNAAPGITGPSTNTDQGDHQAVFATPQDGMNATAGLMLRKFDGGKTTINSLIAERGGWTPGNYEAAKNIAATAGVGPDEPLDLKNNPKQFRAVIRGVLTQEQGKAGSQYSDGMIDGAVSHVLGHEMPDSETPIGLENAKPSGVLGPAGLQNAALLPYLAKGKGPESVANLNTTFAGRLATALQNAPPEVQQGTIIGSGFRSNEEQQAIAAKAQAEHGDDWRRWAAMPGHSNHEKGLASDLGFQNDAARQWWHAHAADYGLKFPLANEDWHIEPTETRGGGVPLQSMQGAGQITPHDMNTVPRGFLPNDPRFAELPFEKRMAIETDAMNAANQTQAQNNLIMTARHQDVFNDMQNAANDGKLGMADIQTARDQGILSKYSEISALQNIIASKQKQNADLDGFNQALSTPGYTFNPVDSAQKKMVDAGYADLSKTVGPIQAAQHIVEKTGIVPTQAVTALRGAMISGDPTRAQNALVTAANILSVNPNILDAETGGKELAKQANTFGHFVNDMGMTPQQATQKVVEQETPEFKRKVDAILKSDKIEDVVKNNLQYSDLEKAFNVGIPYFGRPSVEAQTPQVRTGLMGDYEDWFKLHFQESGDVNQAKALAIKDLQKVWGVTNVNQNKIFTRYPIEQAPAYANIDDVASKAAQAAIEQLKAETGRDVPRDKLILTPNAATPRAWRAGQSLPMTLGWTDSNGLVHVSPKPFVFDAATARFKQNEAIHQKFLEQNNLNKQLDVMQDSGAGAGVYP